MTETKPDFEGVYRRLLIGSRVRLLHGASFSDATVMDKYITEENVSVDLILDNGTVLEHRNIFVGHQMVITILS